MYVCLNYYWRHFCRYFGLKTFHLQIECQRQNVESADIKIYLYTVAMFVTTWCKRNWIFNFCEKINNRKKGWRLTPVWGSVEQPFKRLSRRKLSNIFLKRVKNVTSSLLSRSENNRSWYIDTWNEKLKMYNSQLLSYLMAKDAATVTCNSFSIWSEDGEQMGKRDKNQRSTNYKRYNEFWKLTHAS